MEVKAVWELCEGECLCCALSSAGERSRYVIDGLSGCRTFVEWSLFVVVCDLGVSSIF